MAKKTSAGGVTLLGLGPGDPELLTREAWGLLQELPEIVLRTRQHPVVKGLPATLRVESFDSLYDEAENFEEVYARIVEKVIELARRPQGVVYAVPGHPFVAEATAPEIARRAREAGLPVRVVEGLSFLEPTFSALGVDPLPQTAILDALELSRAHTPPSPPSMAAVIAQIYSPQVASEVKLTLTTVYPDEHPVRLVHAAGTRRQEVEALALYEIDRSPRLGLLSSLYLPPLDASYSFEAFQEVVARLRAPDGCPWDRQQDHQTLRPHLLEEAYELLGALDGDYPPAMCEELGDLLLQILLHAQIASEMGEFTMNDVLRGIHTKIVSRHPHVFGDVQVAGAGDVLLNWERLKAEERANHGKADQGMLASVPLAMPALSLADQYQHRAARVGFDWPDVEGVYAKVLEELDELRAAAGEEERTRELGDLFFALVNLARWLEVDAESALRLANSRFRRRFTYIERAAREQGRALEALSLDEMEALWQAAKAEDD